MSEYMTKQQRIAFRVLWSAIILDVLAPALPFVFGLTIYETFIAYACLFAYNVPIMAYGFRKGVL